MNDKNLGFLLENHVSNNVFTRVDESVALPEGVLMLMKGTFIPMDVKGENGRWYTYADYAPQVELLQPKIARKECFGEIEHPQRIHVPYDLASHRIEEVYFDKPSNSWIGTLAILDTEKGRAVYNIAKTGAPIYVSHRALGSMDKNTGKGILLKLLTWDVTSNPSYKAAEFSKAELINESSYVYLPLEGEMLNECYEELGFTEDNNLSESMVTMSKSQLLEMLNETSDNTMAKYAGMIANSIMLNEHIAVLPSDFVEFIKSDVTRPWITAQEMLDPEFKYNGVYMHPLDINDCMIALASQAMLYNDTAQGYDPVNPEISSAIAVPQLQDVIDEWTMEQEALAMQEQLEAEQASKEQSLNESERYKGKFLSEYYFIGAYETTKHTVKDLTGKDIEDLSESESNKFNEILSKANGSNAEFIFESLITEFTNEDVKGWLKSKWKQLKKWANSNVDATVNIDGVDYVIDDVQEDDKVICRDKDGNVKEFTFDKVYKYLNENNIEITTNHIMTNTINESAELMANVLQILNDAKFVSSKDSVSDFDFTATEDGLTAFNDEVALDILAVLKNNAITASVDGSKIAIAVNVVPDNPVVNTNINETADEDEEKQRVDESDDDFAERMKKAREAKENVNESKNLSSADYEKSGLKKVVTEMNKKMASLSKTSKLADYQEVKDLLDKVNDIRKELGVDVMTLPNIEKRIKEWVNESAEDDGKKDEDEAKRLDESIALFMNESAEGEGTHLPDENVADQGAEGAENPELRYAVGCAFSIDGKNFVVAENNGSSIVTTTEETFTIAELMKEDDLPIPAVDAALEEGKPINETADEDDEKQRVDESDSDFAERMKKAREAKEKNVNETADEDEEKQRVDESDDDFAERMKKAREAKENVNETAEEDEEKQRVDESDDDFAERMKKAREAKENVNESGEHIDESANANEIKKFYEKHGYDSSNIFVKMYGGMPAVIFKKQTKNMMLANKIAEKFSRKLMLTDDNKVSIHPLQSLATMDGENGDYLKVYNALEINESTEDVSVIATGNANDTPNNLDEPFENKLAKDFLGLADKTISFETWIVDLATKDDSITPQVVMTVKTIISDMEAKQMINESAVLTAAFINESAEQNAESKHLKLIGDHIGSSHKYMFEHLNESAKGVLVAQADLYDLNSQNIHNFLDTRNWAEIANYTINESVSHISNTIQANSWGERLKASLRNGR